MKISGGCFDVSRLRDEKASLEEQAAAPEFWNDPNKARETNSRIEAINRILNPFDQVEISLNELLEIIDITASGDSLLDEVAQSLASNESSIRQLELRQMLSAEEDRMPAIVSVNAGSGGTEAQDWAQMLQRMLLRYAQKKGFQVELVDEQAGETAGIKSCSFICTGDNAYGYFKSERGVHRLVRISPFDANKRRHTSFAAVDIVPEIDDSIEIEIRPDDLKVDTYRSGGAGGQHVNKTESAIRITHVPTGTIVACQSQRSQHQNRDTAMKMLRSRLYEQEMQKRQDAVDSRNSEKREISWGSQIRSYVMHPYRMVKDHRTDCESSNVDAVMDGGLEDFVESFLCWAKRRKNNL